MWIPKWYWEAKLRQETELEQRVKRLELITLKDTNRKIASLRDLEAGSVSVDGVSTIEEIASQPRESGGVNMRRGMYEIATYEKKYINQDDALVVVSFQLPRRDWNLLENSDVWCQFEKLLRETRSKHTQKCHREKGG